MLTWFLIFYRPCCWHSLSHLLFKVYCTSTRKGGLSKKQLQGLYSKSQKIKSIPSGKLATLEAIILKRPTRDESPLPSTEPLYKKDEETGRMMAAILSNYPQHKRVLFLKSKYDNNEVLSASEITELQKFSKLLK